MEERFWDAEVDVDPELIWITRNVEPGTRDEALREAFGLLEYRIRTAAGLPSHIVGIDLVNSAFKVDGGILQPISPVRAECVGLHELFQGTFLLYQYPVYRNSHHDWVSKKITLHLVNLLLHLVSKAVNTIVNIAQFMGPHEGRIVNRRDFRFDIDEDGDAEIVSLVDTRPVYDQPGGQAERRLLVVVLDGTDEGYRRIPCEPVDSLSMYGPSRCFPAFITDGKRPDIVAGWTAGENGEQVYIFRWEADRYELVEGDMSNVEHPNPSATIKAFGGHHLYDQLQFVDYDGDGLIEVVQMESIHGGVNTFSDFGFNVEDPSGFFVVPIFRAWKWNPATSRLTVVEESLVP